MSVSLLQGGTVVPIHPRHVLVEVAVHTDCIVLGGVSKTVQIQESMTVKTKYHRGCKDVDMLNYMHVLDNML